MNNAGPATSSPTGRQPGRFFHGVVFFATFLVIAAVFIYFEKLAGEKCTSLTSDYTQALAAGQTYLKNAPDPQLLALKNPYDPETNRDVRVLDTALYRNRYYLYNGITPFITVLVPWLRLTGRQIAESQAIAGYGIGAALCLGFMLWDASRRFFSWAGPGALALAWLAGSLATAGLLLIRNSHIFDLEIAAAWFHDSCALLAAYLALQDRKRRLWWLALAGLSAGLAVGARPNHVGIAVVITVFIFIQVHRMPGDRPTLARRLIMVFAPISVVALGLAWFNWIRFDSPLEFGYRYLLVEVAGFSSDFAGPRNIFYNLWYYLFGFPQLTGWFPFFEAPGQAPFPAPLNYSALLELYGLTVTSPFVFCGLIAVLRRRSLPDSFSSFVCLPMWFGLLNLAFLTIIKGATYRYSADFLPHFGLVGCLGFLLLADRAQARAPSRWFYRTGKALMVFSIVSSFCLSCALFDIMQQKNPVEFARVARVFNQPRLWWGQLQDTPLHQFKITATLPPKRYGDSEPLLVTGRESSQDFIYVYYTAPGYLQVGFEAIGRGGPLSDLVPVDYTQPVVFELALGPEWPPAGAHPYHGLTAAQVGALRRSLIVKVNGKVALDCWVDFHLTKGIYYWGRSPDDSAFGSAFSGAKFTVEKIPAEVPSRLAPAWSQDYGSLNLAFSRASLVTGVREPLVAIGYRHRGQLLSVEPMEGDHVRFVISTPNFGPELVSPAVQVAPQTVHQLTFSSGSLLPSEESSLWGNLPIADRQSLRHHVRVVLDGTVILDGSAEPLELGPAAVKVGHNAMGLSGTAPDFSGQITGFSRSAGKPAGN